VGGDGTVAEVLQGLDLERQMLAILPAGHGNCLARDLAVGRAPRALAALRRGRTLPLDLMDIAFRGADGRTERRLCASTLAVGYVTDVVLLGRREFARLGRASYAVASLVVVPKPFLARLDGPAAAYAWQSRTGIVVNNTAHLANYRGFPNASLRDGMLDVMEQRCAWPRQLLHNASVLAGSQRFGAYRMCQVAIAHVQLETPRTIMADGELLHAISSVAVECRPAAVRCITGEP
jgi:diacylglycerol kinase family enzyme